MQSRLLDKHTKRSLVNDEATCSWELLEVESCLIAQSPLSFTGLGWTRHPANGHLVLWLETINGHCP